ncbi:MAG: leucine-rich repeat domain-containing protein [Angelakisella sp.]
MIEIKINGMTPSYSDTTLENAIVASGVNKLDIISIEVLSGVVTPADFAVMRNELPNLETLIIQASAAIQDNTIPVEAFGDYEGQTQHKKIRQVFIYGTAPLIVGASAFDSCYTLENIEINSAVTLEQYAFYGNAASALHFPNVTAIGHGAVSSSDTLITIDFPILTSTADYGFSQNLRLLNINLPEVVAIATGTFVSCFSLEQVELPKVKIIEEFSFAYCNFLSEVTLPSVTDIYDAAFYECPKLLALYLGVTPPTIHGDSVFGLENNIRSVSSFSMRLPKKLEAKSNIRPPFLANARQTLPEERTVFVPNSSIALYDQSSDTPNTGIWYGFIIKGVYVDLRTQAISDLIESVALQQTALSHILNAEGEKIQRAVALQLPIEDMLKVNKSVKDMANAITQLEMVLQGKLQLFGDCLCEQ